MENHQPSETPKKRKTPKQQRAMSNQEFLTGLKTAFEDARQGKGMDAKLWINAFINECSK